MYKQQVELQTCKKGEVSQRMPNSYKLWTLNLKAKIDNFNTYLYTFARTIKG